jgi:hypothetical protein
VDIHVSNWHAYEAKTEKMTFKECRERKCICPKELFEGKSHEQYYSTLNHVLSVIQGKTYSFLQG